MNLIMVRNTKLSVTFVNFLQKNIKILKLKTDYVRKDGLCSYVAECCLSSVSVDILEDIEVKRVHSNAGIVLFRLTGSHILTI